MRGSGSHATWVHWPAPCNSLHPPFNPMQIHITLQIPRAAFSHNFTTNWPRTMVIRLISRLNDRRQPGIQKNQSSLQIVERAEEGIKRNSCSLDQGRPARLAVATFHSHQPNFPPESSSLSGGEALLRDRVQIWVK